MVKFIVTKFDKFSFYTGESEDATGSIGFCYQKEEDDDLTKTFLFIDAGLEKAKMWMIWIHHLKKCAEQN